MNLIIAILLFTSPDEKQFSWAEVGIDGLTCSMCARSVEMTVRKLDFVDDVDMNLKKTTMRVAFKKDVPADMGRLADGVDDSGFSVNHLYASYAFSDVPARDGDCITIGGTTLSFVGTGMKTLRGETLLKFIGEGFLPKSELDAWIPQLRSSCDAQDGKINFVTVM